MSSDGLYALIDASKLTEGDVLLLLNGSKLMAFAGAERNAAFTQWVQKEKEGRGLNDQVCISTGIPN